MRLFFMKKITASASTQASAKPMTRVTGMVTSPPANCQVGRPACADWVSGPNAKFRLCWMTMAMPKVASSEVNRSRVITLLTTRR